MRCPAVPTSHATTVLCPQEMVCLLSTCFNLMSLTESVKQPKLPLYSNLYIDSASNCTRYMPFLLPQITLAYSIATLLPSSTLPFLCELSRWTNANRSTYLPCTQCHFSHTDNQFHNNNPPSPQYHATIDP